MKKVIDNRHFKVPNGIFRAGLNKYELLVLIYLIYHQNNKQIEFPRYQEIAQFCTISRSKAMKVVNRLIAKGIIVKQMRPGTYRKNYSALYHIVINVPKNNDT
jgi:predicted transcriptional regulator